MKEQNGLTLHVSPENFYTLNVACHNCMHHFEARFKKGNKRSTRYDCPNCACESEIEVDSSALYRPAEHQIHQLGTPREPDLSQIIANMTEQLKIVAAHSEMLASAIKRLDHHDQSFNGVLLSYANIGTAIQQLSERVKRLEEIPAKPN